MIPADHRLIRRVVDEIWNADQLEVADELFAAQYINHGGLIIDLLRGPEAVKMGVVLHRRAFPHLHVGIEGLWSAAGLTVLHWHAHAEQAAGGVAASGPSAGGNDPPVGLSGVTTAVVEAGQVQESWTEWDQQAMERYMERNQLSPDDLGVDQP